MKIVIALGILAAIYAYYIARLGLRNIAPGRKYTSGSSWTFWRWSGAASGYITRLHIFMCPWFAVCLHFIQKPDAEPHLHDHPVSFLSLVLKGWYKERRRTNPATLDDGGFWGIVETRRWYNFIRAALHDRHCITEVSPGGCITLAFMTKVKRRWGFHTPEGWVYYKDYYAENVVVARHGRIYEMSRKTFYHCVEEGLCSYENEIVNPTIIDRANADFLVSREEFYKKVRFL